MSRYLYKFKRLYQPVFKTVKISHGLQSSTSAVISTECGAGTSRFFILSASTTKGWFEWLAIRSTTLLSA
jgi:hypothetical protein